MTDETEARWREEQAKIMERYLRRIEAAGLTVGRTVSDIDAAREKGVCYTCGGRLNEAGLCYKIRKGGR